MKLFNLSNKQMIVVIIMAVVLNIIALKTDINVWLDIPCFAFASYALVLFILLIVRNYRYFTAWLKSWSVWKEVRKLPLGERILDDAVFRTKMGLYFGAVINTIYVIIKLVTGIIYKSNWLEVLAVYMISHSTKMIKKQEL